MSGSEDRRAALRDAAGGAVLIGIAGLYHWQTLAIPQSSLSDDVGADGIPLALTVGLATVGLLILLRGLIAVRRSGVMVTGPRGGGEHAASLPRALGFLAIGVAYMVAAPVVGYVLGTALLVGAVALYERAAPSWRLAATALAGGVFFWAVFVKALGTEQPAGWLF